jgi:hypothetical protein
MKKRKAKNIWGDEVEIDVPEGIIAHLTRECGGNVHDRNVIEVTSGSFEKETVGANPDSGAYGNHPNSAAKNATDLETDFVIQSVYCDRSEDLPPRNQKLVIPVVIPADVHQPDEAALHATRNHKCASRQPAVDLAVVLLAGNLPPVLPVRPDLNQPRFQMRAVRTSTIRADCVVSWLNPPLIEIVAYPIVPHVRNIFFVIVAIS